MTLFNHRSISVCQFLFLRFVFYSNEFSERADGVEKVMAFQVAWLCMAFHLHVSSIQSQKKTHTHTEQIKKEKQIEPN